MRLSEELFELSESYDITRKNFSRRLDALEAKVEKVEKEAELSGELINHLANEKVYKHSMQYPRMVMTIKEEGSDTVFTHSWLCPKPFKTCGTCKFWDPAYVNGCWRKYDGKKFWVAIETSVACPKHEREE